jgi:hypothetical protein
MGPEIPSQLVEACHHHKRQVWISWHLDETSMLSQGGVRSDRTLSWQPRLYRDRWSKPRMPITIK